MHVQASPRVYNALRGEAVAVRDSQFGSVGDVFSGEGIELVWVAKEDEEIDPDWFSQDTVDLLVVVEGRLRVEFADPGYDDVTLQPGDVFVLPATVRCRTYRWPRESSERAVFVAVYPKP